MILRLRQNLELSFNILFGIEVGLRIYLSEEKREEELDLGNFCPKKQKGERQLNLKEIVQVKREKGSKVKQVRRGVRSPVR